MDIIFWLIGGVFKVVFLGGIFVLLIIFGFALFSPIYIPVTSIISKMIGRKKGKRE